MIVYYQSALHTRSFIWKEATVRGWGRPRELRKEVSLNLMTPSSFHTWATWDTAASNLRSQFRGPECGSGGFPGRREPPSPLPPPWPLTLRSCNSEWRQGSGSKCTVLSGCYLDLVFGYQISTSSKSPSLKCTI